MNNMMDYLLRKSAGMQKEAGDIGTLSGYGLAELKRAEEPKRSAGWRGELPSTISNIGRNVGKLGQRYLNAYGDQFYGKRVLPVMKKIDRNVADYAASKDAEAGAAAYANDYADAIGRGLGQLQREVGPEVKGALRNLWQRYGRGNTKDTTNPIR